MDKWEKTVLKMVLGGISIFLVGVFAGYNLENNAIESIQGFLFNAAGFATDPNATDANATDANATDANATDANATDANATDANATDANATDANATDANATSANVSLTDNIIYLQNFYLDNKTVKSGDRVNVTINTVGAPISGTTLVFKNTSLGVSFTAKVESLYNNPYIIIPSSIADATYAVEEVLIIGRNSDDTTFSKKYSLNDNDNKLPTRYELTVKNQVEVKKELELTGIVFNKTQASKGDKIYLNIESTELLDNLRLKLESNNDSMSVTVKDLNSNPYFEIPATTEEGIFNLTKVMITSKGNTKVYSSLQEENTQNLPFTISLEVLKGENEKTIYPNEKITSEIITQIYNSSSDIEINGDDDSVIKKDVFDAMKGKRNNLIINIGENQIVFNGRDIKDTKAIDASMKFEKVSQNDKIKNLISEGVVLSLADNGNLPGPALYRIKAGENTSSLANTIYVYSFNDSYNKFVLIASKVMKNAEGYYEFTLTHNSDYVLVNQELDNSITMKAEENVVDFQKSNKSNLALIIGGIVFVLIGTFVIIMARRLKNKQKSAL